MFAIFQTGGKQYKIKAGEIIRVEKLDVVTGEIIEFNKVMAVYDSNSFVHIGYPFINGSRIIAKVINHGRNKKITVVKFNRRKHFRKHQGHRQKFTDIQIIDIKI